jgi:Nif-specific regulatory protein
VLVGTEALGSLTAETVRTQPDELHVLERFLTIVAAMLAVDVSHRTILERERTQLAKENVRLRDALGEKLGPERIIGSSRPMRDVYARISQVAGSDTTVLIRGESGTGKELVASALHYASPRSKGPFVRVNVAALGESLLESELFGHEKGAFTGALQSRIGRIEEAQGGTLFLDEVGDFSPIAQVKLLRVLQEREFERVGSNRTIHADVRIIAATNRNLEQAVTDGVFRNDLYYRINVFPLNIPPLRARRGDILLLANHFAEIFARRMKKAIARISTPAIDALLSYHWPGNVRELENAIEHAVLLATDDVIFEHNLPPTLQLPHATTRPASSLALRVESLERDMIQDALKRTGGNVAAAARELGLTARVTRYKMKILGLRLQETSHESLVDD